MIFSMRSVAAAAFVFAALGNSHLIITSPVPYGKATLNNSPLVNTAIGSANSDYPCKQRPGVYDITTMNHMAVGEPQTLSFMGSASHGGGTCQLAITLDKEPTANSTFKLIQVFEGGCPTLSEDGTTHPFTFVVPKGFPNGQATFAWMWYNRIGNREIYMNCAPITVTGGSDSQDYFNSLPNAYLINLPTSDCQSTFQFNSNAVTIPHPGQFILTEFTGQEMHAATGPHCSDAAAAQLAGVVGYKSQVIKTNGASYSASGDAAGAAPSAPAGSGSPSASGGAGSSVAAPSGSAAPGGGSSAAPSAQASSAPAGGNAAVPSASGGAVGASSMASASAAPSGSAAAPSGGASAAPSSNAAAPSGSAAPSAAPSGSAVASVGASGSAVPSAAPSAAPSGSPSTSEGISCSSDGKQFGVEVNGKMVWRAVAPGTTCSGGTITRRNVLRHAHARRRLQHAGKLLI